MHYCLVVNTRRYYSTLCEAQGERNGVSPPDTSNAAGFNFPREQAEAQKNELASKAARLNASHLGRGSGGAGGQLHEDIVVRLINITHPAVLQINRGRSVGRQSQQDVYLLSYALATYFGLIKPISYHYKNKYQVLCNDSTFIVFLWDPTSQLSLQ